jgi:hypothetical protein
MARLCTYLGTLAFNAFLPEEVNLKRRPKSLIVYVDQNVWSEIAKAIILKKVNGRDHYVALYNAMLRATEAGRVRLVRSKIGELETGLISGRELRDAVFSAQAKLGSIDVLVPDAIKRAQLAQAIAVYSASRTYKPTLRYRDVLEQHPDVAPASIDFRDPIDPRTYDYHGRRIATAEALIPIWSQVPNTHAAFGAYRERVLIEERDLWLKPSLLHELSCQAATDEHVTETFLRSDLFRLVPFVDVGVSVYAKRMTRRPPPRPGDGDDMFAIEAYLPYSDIYVCEQSFGQSVVDLGFPDRYGCYVCKTKELNIRELANRIETMTPIAGIVRRSCRRR